MKKTVMIAALLVAVLSAGTVALAYSNKAADKYGEDIPVQSGQALTQQEQAKQAEKQKKEAAEEKAQADFQAEAVKKAEAIKKAEAAKQAEATKQAEAAKQAETNKTAEVTPETSGSAVTPTPSKTEVAQTNPVSSTYFDDALFIGDSRTEGLMLYSGLSKATFYTGKGLSVSDVFDKATVKQGSKKVSIATAIKNKKFGKYYIMLGANELGWVYPAKFVEKYGAIIDTIKEANPEGVIYVQSILPVTKEKSDRDGTYNNKNIDRFNAMLETLATDKDVHYLQVREAVENENRALCDEATTDGVHLNKDYCLKWVKYLEEHTVS